MVFSILAISCSHHLKLLPRQCRLVLPLHRRLNEQLDRSQRVAKFMGDAGRQLPNRRQSLGQHRLTAGLLEFFHHLPEAGGDCLHLLVQSRQIVAGFAPPPSPPRGSGRPWRRGA